MKNYKKYIFDLDLGYTLLIPDWSKKDAIKPHREAFELAIGETDKEDCVMIGDSVRSD